MRGRIDEMGSRIRRQNMFYEETIFKSFKLLALEVLNERDLLSLSCPCQSEFSSTAVCEMTGRLLSFLFRR